MKKTCLSDYRLNDYTELDQLAAQMGRKEFHTFANDLFLRLDRMKPRTKTAVAKLCAPNQIEACIKVICWFIDLTPHSKHEFSSDYTEIKRYE